MPFRSRSGVSSWAALHRDLEVKCGRWFSDSIAGGSICRTLNIVSHLFWKAGVDIPNVMLTSSAEADPGERSLM